MNSFWNGKRRFVALLMFLAGVFVALEVPPVIPFIQLPGEKFPEGFDIPLTGIRWTNTMVGSVIVWVVLLLFVVYVARRRPKDGNEVPPGGFYYLFEVLFEGLMGFVGGIAGGRHFRVIFNMFMTIFLVVLMANWMELVPGVDTIGFIHPHVKEKYDAQKDEYKLVTTDGYEIYQGFLGISYVNGQCDWISPAAEAAADEAAIVAASAAAAAAERTLTQDAAYARYQAEHKGHGDDATGEGGGGHGDDAHGEEPLESNTVSLASAEVLAARVAEKQARLDRGCHTGVATAPWQDGYEPYDKSKAKGISLHPDPSSEEAKLVPWVVLPFVRVPSTDLNMTLTIALISFVMIQYIGFKALGIGYLTKFFNFGTLFKSPLGGIDVAVGLLELIGDFAKILSFSFRLLGNIFAGSILLFVMSFLIPILPWPFFILEFFVGVIQALVFALLTAIFMNLATISHHHDDDHDHDEAH
ncbi:MAG: F0F1 ATP synthase subunit A [Chloroflexi bacterium]|nr:F0F1 ATP synthase subunit A [Chloroflexota bacterium]